MSLSNWDEWVAPDMGDDNVPCGAGIVVDDVDDTQVEPIVAASSWEEWRLGRGDRPVLVPLFPVGYFTPGSACPHHGDIPAGSTLCCMVCHQSGMDKHPGLKESAAGALKLKNWKAPEGGDQWSDQDLAEPTKYEGAPKQATRKQKRSEQFRRPTA